MLKARPEGAWGLHVACLERIARCVVSVERWKGRLWEAKRLKHAIDPLTPGSRFPVLGSWFPVPGFRFPVLGS